MLISAILSKPAANVEEKLGAAYQKIKITAGLSASTKNNMDSKAISYFVEAFTKTQVFHKHLTEQEAENFISENAGITFKNCIKKTETQEITILANKKGNITTLTKPIQNQNKFSGHGPLSHLAPELNDSKKKNYLIEEGTPVPFLVLLGVMTDKGKIIASKYDKFRQINRFLEFLNDILPELTKITSKENRPVRIADFGCGKSYLTFAVHYFLTEIKQIPCQIEGLDLKKDVIDYCNSITKKLNLQNLIFHTGNIADYSNPAAPDLVITLHACDTATDFALKYAVSKNATAILSVPCCQHQINQQLKGTKSSSPLACEFSPLLKWGLLREKFSSLVTDALRGEWLEQQGYSVQMLEFIDMEHTPKNILIRAVRQSAKADSRRAIQGSASAPASSLAALAPVVKALPITTAASPELPELAKALKITPEIYK